MKPTYTFEEMRTIIRRVNCFRDVVIIEYLLRLEGNRYTWEQQRGMFKQLKVAERMLVR